MSPEYLEGYLPYASLNPQASGHCRPRGQIPRSADSVLRSLRFRGTRRGDSLKNTVQSGTTQVCRDNRQPRNNYGER